MTDDQDLMAALFVSEQGIIEAHPEWCGDLYEWPDEWSIMSEEGVPDAVIAGILRLIRERDEFLEGNDHWVKMHDREATARAQAERERDEAREYAENYYDELRSLGRTPLPWPWKNPDA